MDERIVLFVFMNHKAILNEKKKYEIFQGALKNKIHSVKYYNKIDCYYYTLQETNK